MKYNKLKIKYKERKIVTQQKREKREHSFLMNILKLDDKTTQKKMSTFCDVTNCYTHSQQDT